MSIKTYEERLVGLRPLQTYVPEHLLRAEIAELRAENERYRVALDSIAIETHDDSAEKVARKALGNVNELE